jgi:hypothetical protein
MPMSAVPPGSQPRGGFPRTPTPGFGNQPPSTYTGTGPTPPPFLGGGGPPTPTPKSIFDQGLTGEVRTVGPIVGVRTKIRQKALQKWRDHEYTDEWRFIAGDADSDQPNQRITYPVIPANPNPQNPPPQQPRT